jgi:putative MATE family efflux protein
MVPDLDLLRQPIPHLLRRLAIPAGTGFFFTTMFNVVDTFYGGSISTTALAALGLAFPVFFIVIAIGGGISTGATALTGHLLGSGDEEGARLQAAQTISFALLHGILLFIVGSTLTPVIFRLLGADGDYLRLAVEYMNALFIGAPFFIGNHAINSTLNAWGDPRPFRNFLVAGFLANLVLDPLFIFGWGPIPPQGLSGIAWATVVIHLSGSLYLLHAARRTGLIDGRTPGLMVPRRRPYLDLMRQGFPASITMLTVALGIFVITWYLGRFGSQAVAAYSIGARVEQMAVLPIMGLNIATLALVAQNSGARDFGRVRETVRWALAAGLSLTLCSAVPLFLLATTLAGLFTSDREVAAIAGNYLHFSAFTLPAYLVLYVCSFALQGLKRPLFPIMLGVYRQLLAPLPLFWLLAFVLGLGISGIWWSILSITWSAALVAITVTLVTVRRLADGGAGKESLP